MKSTLSGGRGLHNRNNCINFIVFPIGESWDIVRGKCLEDVIYGGSPKPMLGDNELRREQDKGLRSEPAIVL